MTENLRPPLARVDGILEIGKVNCVDLAKRYGTPLYVMDESRIRDNYRRLRDAFSSRWSDFGIHYAMKANNNLSVLNILRQEGSGVDCSCLEEVQLAQMAGFGIEDMLLTANYLDDSDLAEALRLGLTVNLDDPSHLAKLTKGNAPEHLCLRINPGYGKGSFPSLVLAGSGSKFGMSEETALKAFATAKSLGIREFGLHMMAGSCVLDRGYFGEITSRLLDIASKIESAVGIQFSFINVGGGFGVPYRPEEAPLDVEGVAEEITNAMKRSYGSSSGGPRLLIEPGRFIVCDSAVLLARVRAVKESNPPFVGLDAGMNTLLRPALYGAFHEVLLANRLEERIRLTNLCGTICENTDILARDRPLPVMVPGDIVAILNAGAYGFIMSSQYNSRPRSAEVLVCEGEHHLVRGRETVADVVGRQEVPRRLQR